MRQKKKKGQWAIFKTKRSLGTSQIISVSRVITGCFLFCRHVFLKLPSIDFIHECILECFQNKAVYITDFITMVSDEWTDSRSFNIISLFSNHAFISGWDCIKCMCRFHCHGLLNVRLCHWHCHELLSKVCQVCHETKQMKTLTPWLSRGKSLCTASCTLQLSISVKFSSINSTSYKLHLADLDLIPWQNSFLSQMKRQIKMPSAQAMNIPTACLGSSRFLHHLLYLFPQLQQTL